MRTYDPSRVVVRFGDRVVPVEAFAFVPDGLPRCEHGKIRCGSCRESAKDRGAIVVEGVEVFDALALPAGEPGSGRS